MKRTDRESFFFTGSPSETDAGKVFDQKVKELRKMLPKEPTVERKRASSFGNSMQAPGLQGGHLGWTNSAESVAAPPWSTPGKYAGARRTSTPTISTSKLPVIKPKTPTAPRHAPTTPHPKGKIHDKEYDMNHKSRGRVVILNHKRFKEGLDEREGTEVDVNRLRNSLLKIGYKKSDIQIYHDLSWTKIDKLIDGISREDHTNNDCLMFFVLTHGDDGDRIHAFDIDYSVDKLWKPFTADKCTTLAGKPKIFFIIACRGVKADSGVRVTGQPQRKQSLHTETDASPMVNSSYTIPVWADFLMVYSTMPGYFSYREAENGTWYIRALCDEIDNSSAQPLHFMDLLTAVNQRVAINFETFHDNPLVNKKKQCPIITSSLTRVMHLT